MANKPHHAGAHRRLGEPAIRYANAHPDYRCPRCGLTFVEMAAAHGLAAAKWIKGHKRPGTIARHPNEYQAEHSRCSAQEGATTRNQRSTHGYDWP